MSLIKQQLIDIFNSALSAADPYNAVKKTIKATDNRLRVNGSISIMRLLHKPQDYRYMIK